MSAQHKASSVRAAVGTLDSGGRMATPMGQLVQSSVLSALSHRHRPYTPAVKGLHAPSGIASHQVVGQHPTRHRTLSLNIC